MLTCLIGGLLMASSANAFVWDNPRPSAIQSANGVRVIWWNVQFGETNRRIAGKTGKPGPLGPNARELAAIADLLVLGEYSPDTFDPATLKALKERYPYSPPSFWPYNPHTPERGLMLFSKFPFKVVREALLDYTPPGVSGDKAARYKADWAKDFPPERFFPRTYLNLEISHPKGAFHLVPFHGLVHVEKEYREVGGGFWAILKIKLGLAFGSANPMIYQLTRLRDELKRDFGPRLDARPLIMTGDFNLPRKIFGLRTRAYKTVSPDLRDAFEGNEIPSWPMPSSKEFEEISIRAQIDHAFTSDKLRVTAAQILPLAGSDHAALLLDIAAR